MPLSSEEEAFLFSPPIENAVLLAGKTGHRLYSVGGRVVEAGCVDVVWSKYSLAPFLRDPISRWGIRHLAEHLFENGRRGCLLGDRNDGAPRTSRTLAFHTFTEVSLLEEDFLRTRGGEGGFPLCWTKRLSCCLAELALASTVAPTARWSGSTVLFL